MLLGEEIGSPCESDLGCEPRTSNPKSLTRVWGLGLGFRNLQNSRTFEALNHQKGRYVGLEVGFGSQGSGILA